MSVIGDRPAYPVHSQHT